ncbi:Aste57867_20879 [Aphanomyces stellatus]|uniref:Aste57867_20879 protein n=1 Tax=Aphanomyces stellatus TaxID=120398 RepID=A0A485LHI0_9STRA|nr:hypothetical protein As57867_020811 [Aphanomyces stellatus]VFT97556.1 Aste57867_20879 [Aphanomyces stellatus]
MDYDTTACCVCEDATNGPHRTPAELLLPCTCPTPIHRGCLVGWRSMEHAAPPQAHCPRCQTQYNLERGRSQWKELQLAVDAAKATWWSMPWQMVLYGTMLQCFYDAGSWDFASVETIVRIAAVAWSNVMTVAALGVASITTVILSRVVCPSLVSYVRRVVTKPKTKSSRKMSNNICFQHVGRPTCVVSPRTKDDILSCAILLMPNAF